VKTLNLLRRIRLGRQGAPSGGERKLCLGGGAGAEGGGGVLLQLKERGEVVLEPGDIRLVVQLVHLAGDPGDGDASEVLAGKLEAILKELLSKNGRMTR
jgi:hypothetical protein